MYHYIYRIDNLINGKYYLDDDYMGSGPLIKAAIKKYGIENFKKTILATFSTSEEAFEYEAQIVTLKEVNDPMCYNVQPGGRGKQKRFTDEELREHRREYYQQNRESLKQGMREYNQQNKERHREYYQQNKESIREYQREYQQRPDIKQRARENYARKKAEKLAEITSR